VPTAKVVGWAPILTNYNIDALCVAWRKALRRIWNLPSCTLVDCYHSFVIVFHCLMRFFVDHLTLFARVLFMTRFWSVMWRNMVRYRRYIIQLIVLLMHLFITLLILRRTWRQTAYRDTNVKRPCILFSQWFLDVSWRTKRLHYLHLLKLMALISHTFD